MCMVQNWTQKNKTQVFVSDYADAIMKLAQEDNVEIKRKQLANAF